MRNLALSIAAVLVLAVVSPAVAQPFADVPTDHWAFDAIAELAAKGVIEGYPDGTFKGDRGITRYEVAMIVARILARIEAIKVPGPAAPAPAPAAPPAAVTPAQIQTIQRLVNEFRAELAALGVRVTAVEEELAALKGAKDATVTTGDYTYVATFAEGALPTVERARGRLTFKGTAGGDTAFFLRARWNQQSSDPGTPINTTDFDRTYFDWKSWGVSFRLGRDYWSLGEGILLSSAETTGSANGLRASGSFAGFSWTVLGYYNGTTGATSDSSTTYAASVGLTFAGWSLGVNYRDDRDYGGPSTGSAVPPPSGAGYSVNFGGELFGFDLSGEYASYTPTGGTAATAYIVNLGIDLGGMGMMSGWSPALNVWYKDYQAAYPAQDSNIYSLGGFWVGGELNQVTAFGGDLSLQVSDALSVKVAYESGTTPVYTVLLAGLEYGVANNTTLGLEYISSTGAATETRYGTYLTYSW